MAVAAGCGLLALLVALALGFSIDRWALLHIRAATGGTGAFIAFAKGITAFGNDVTLWTVTLLVAGYLLAIRRHPDALHLLAAGAGGAVLVTALKALVARPRPTLVEHLVDVQRLSFPSGHAADSAFVYGTLALIAARAAGSRAGGVYLAAATTLLVVVIGGSRVVLGVHWPSDVLAGWALGAGWALLVARIAHLKGARDPSSLGARAAP